MEKMQNASALLFISLLLAAGTIIFRLITKGLVRFASVALIAAMTQVSLTSPPSAQTTSAEKNAREVLGSSSSETVEQIEGTYRAIADYTKAIKLEPDMATNLNARGYAYQAEGNHDRAIADYDQARRRTSVRRRSQRKNLVASLEEISLLCRRVVHGRVLSGTFDRVSQSIFLIRTG
jgi:tetratricopeptide (TPR) repeat protein